MLRRFRHTFENGEFAGLEFGDPIKDFSAVFLHATGFNAMTYQSMLAPLGLRARIGALDLRGHGRSKLKTFPRMASWNRHRDDVIHWLEQHAPQGVVLGGHSMGGCVALLVAGKRPDLVRGLVLADPVILAPKAYRTSHLLPFSHLLLGRRHPLSIGARRRRNGFASLAQAKKTYHGRGAFKTWREPFLDDYLLDALDRTDDNPRDSEDQTWTLLCDPKVEAATYSAQRNRPWKALRRIKKAGIPLTILRAEKASVISEKVGYRILRKYPQAIVKTQRGTTHFLPMEAPYLVRDELSSMISRLIEGFGAGEEGAVKRSLRIQGEKP